MVFDRLRRGRTATQVEGLSLSFGSWERLAPGSVVQVCHPRWRGVRSVTYGFGGPIVECDDLDASGPELVARMGGAGVRLVVIQGWPPGAAGFARSLARARIVVKCVLHSSPVQHGAEPGEAQVVDEVLGLAKEGTLAAVGMAKAGVTDAFGAVGHPVAHVPNRAPAMGEWERTDLGPGLHIGVFAEPFWRKNVTTQLLAVGLLDGATAHVMTKPANRYLEELSVVEHGELPYSEFLSLQGSTDLNLYVTLSECHPSTPQESYLAGVPCLISRTSAVFRSDQVLWELTTVDEPDNPEAIANGARRLLAGRDEAVRRARAWIEDADRLGTAAWEKFTA